MEALTFIKDINASIAPSSNNTTPNKAIVAIVFLGILRMLFRFKVTKANVPINKLKDIADDSTDLGSIKDNNAIIPAKIPIITVIVIKVRIICFVFLAFSVAIIIIEKHNINVAIAVVAAANFVRSNKLNKAIAADNISIDNDIFNIILPALSACFPANSDNFTKPPNITNIRPIATIPFVIPPIDNPAIILIAKAKKNTDIPIPRNIFPA